jgi:hypothetical protein
MQVTINGDQQLFVIKNNLGFSCFGFDNCFKDSLQLSELLNRPDLAPKEEDKGKVIQYHNYQTLVSIATKSGDLGTWFSTGTDQKVKNILETAINDHSKLRIFYGDSVTGKSWMDEFDMYGRIGRSCGTLKIPLMIEDGELGGSGILTDRIIKIVKFSKRGGISIPFVLYEIENFNLPTMKIVENEHPEYAVSVLCDDVVHARLKTMAKADKWVKFMNGLTPKP